MSAPNRCCVHEIEAIDDFPFDPVKYSQFKFGCGDTASEYANELSLIISEKIMMKINDAPIIIYPSPYSFLPTASCHMTFLIIDILKKSFPGLEINNSKINRKNTYFQDYGELDSEGRYNLIKNDTYEILDNPAKDAILIFIDDISVTGTHERIIEEVLAQKNINNNRFFCYYAIVKNKEIPPNIENKLNYFSIHSLHTLANICSKNNFMLNTRFVKRILSLPQQEFYQFYNLTKDHVDKNFWNTIINGSENNSYDKISVYINNLKIVKSIINSNKEFSVNENEL